MSAKKISSDRKRSRPVEKRSKITAVKGSKLWMGVILVLIAVVAIAAIYVYVGSDTNDTSENGDNVVSDNPIAVINITMGNITKDPIKIELYEDKVPNTCDNFINLANDGFYDGLVFHRVIDGFMIQGGGFYPNGTKKDSPDTIDLETDPDVRHVDGAISMARLADDINSATSQFFICDDAQPGLDDDYAVFGVVIEGMDVVRAIASVDATAKYGHNDWPVEDVFINSITVENQ